MRSMAAADKNFNFRDRRHEPEPGDIWLYSPGNGDPTQTWEFVKRAGGWRILVDVDGAMVRMWQREYQKKLKHRGVFVRAGGE